MKKILATIIAFAMSNTVMANTTMQGMSVVGGMATNASKSMMAIPRMTFGCDDEKYGHFDACADMLVFPGESLTTVNMKVNLSQQFTQENPNILVRYILIGKINKNPFDPKKVYVRDMMTGTTQLYYVPAGTLVYIARHTNDGGVTWSDLKYDHRS
jgi:hypothetical protein